MRILYVVDNWPSLFGAYVLREAKWMKDRGHRVAVVSLACGGPHGFREETAGYVELSDFGVEDIPVLRLESKQLTMDETAAGVLSFARRQETELIDAHFAREPAEVALAVTRASGIPFTVRLRGGDIHTNTSPKLGQIMHYASAICPMSNFLSAVLTGKRRLKRTPEGIPANVSPGKIRVTPNSLPSRYCSARPVAQSDEVHVVGAIGRLVPIKRLPDLLQAVGDLAGDFPGLRLLIIGGGVTMDELQALAESIGLSDRCEVTGFKSWQEVVALAGRLHIYVQASELEGCSLATIEAGFKGIPLVLSRTGASEESVEHGMNGYLFDPGDVTALRESLRKLLVGGKKRREEMGAASLKIVGERFSSERNLPRIEAIFQAVINHEALPA
jgi:glycosyltransferase involved in cell wall biosynthesis